MLIVENTKTQTFSLERKSPPKSCNQGKKPTLLIFLSIFLHAVRVCVFIIEFLWLISFEIISSSSLFVILQ